MKFGICGYGNLGRAVEEKILSDGRDEIVGVFSRREDVLSEKGTPVYRYDDAKEFEGKIDVMIMCGGSQEDLLCQSPEMLEWFDIIDTFDTHAKIHSHRKKLEEVSTRSGHKAIYSCGWDPGIFSLIRTLCGNIFDFSPQTFWGKGVSQGHSEALRNIAGVADAIQFTVPNESVLNEVKAYPTSSPDDNEKHMRECHIALDGTRAVEDIIRDIENTENYFKGQKVIIYVDTLDEISNLKKSMHHKGIVLGGDERSQIEFNVKMQNNPNFTMQVVLAYAHALPKLPCGVYSVLDIPIGLIGCHENYHYL